MPDAAALLNLATTDPAGVVLYDRSHWGRLRLTGDDRLRFLHNQTTNAIQTRQPGECCDTTFVTSTARTIDLSTAIVTETELLAIVSPERRADLLPLMDRYIFPMDRVELSDVTDQTACFSAIGAGCAALGDRLGVKLPAAGTHGTADLDLGGQPIPSPIPVRWVGSSGLSDPGFTAIVDKAQGAALKSALIDAGATPIDDTDWETLRILNGRPRPDHELTDDYNPLEAGLWHTLSFNKGCYIGQETIARLNTYKGVKQQLWGLRSDVPLEPGTPLTVDDTKVGVVTSAITTDSGAIGLGYVRTKAGSAGLTLTAGDAAVKTVDIPHATRGYLAKSAE